MWVRLDRKADPDTIRQLETGQACYIHRGTATFVQVARPKPSPVALPGARRAASPAAVPAHASAPPDGGPDGHRSQVRAQGRLPALDDVLGPGPCPYG
jgi:hypothetical protein